MAQQVRRSLCVPFEGSSALQFIPENSYFVFRPWSSPPIGACAADRAGRGSRELRDPRGGGGELGRRQQHIGGDQPTPGDLPRRRGAPEAEPAPPGGPQGAERRPGEGGA